MRKNLLITKRAKELFIKEAKKYDKKFVKKYEGMLVSLALAQADVEELCLDIQEEGKMLRSRTNGNKYANPAVNILAQREKRYDSAVKILNHFEELWKKENTTDSLKNSGRKPQFDSTEQRLLKT